MLPESPPIALAEYRTVVLACPAMGTRFEFVLVGEDDVRLRAAGEAAVGEILDWHSRLNWFSPASFLSYVNSNAGARAVECDTEFFDLLLLCRNVWEASNGAFDPTIAALMRASGFRDSARDPGAIAAAVRGVGFDKVRLDESRRTIRFVAGGVALDFGAVGKGWALDSVRAILIDAGVHCALVHGGTSSVLALDPPPGQDAWKVAIGHDQAAPVIRLVNSALGVSAPHGRTADHAGESHGHVLDPRTGRSARGARLAAVLADSAAAADAWSTALLVEGRRPAGMPPDFHSLLAPIDGCSHLWRAAGPGGHRTFDPARDNPFEDHS